MPGLDTNVLVRWLVADDEDQTARAERLFRAAQAHGTRLFVPLGVTLELEWVLRSRYGFDKGTALATFSALLETRELDFQDEAGIERALHAWRLGAAEFADCLHAGVCAAHGQEPLLSFDVKAARLPGVQLIRS
jgi:predicted nucleic-acid-binding protein